MSSLGEGDVPPRHGNGIFRTGSSGSSARKGGSLRTRRQSTDIDVVVSGGGLAGESIRGPGDKSLSMRSVEPAESPPASRRFLGGDHAMRSPSSGFAGTPAQQRKFWISRPKIPRSVHPPRRYASNFERDIPLHHLLPCLRTHACRLLSAFAFKPLEHLCSETTLSSVPLDLLSPTIRPKNWHGRPRSDPSRGCRWSPQARPKTLNPKP